ncbi:MAG: cation:proton antiporter [Candidatus Aceula meridiana]|nr:cation:proton antiporter [Candidatus Aceula meridiana]
MALSIAELIILSLIVDWLFRRCNIPGLVGMLLVGIAIGPYVLGLLNPALISVSSDLRMIALIVILLRAGFELSKETLRKVGFHAFLLSFIPAIFEGVAITFLAHSFLHLSYMESAILGSILSAVSPAVVVPLMIRFIEQRKGVKKGIPTLVLAASSIDDVFVIVIYSVLIGMYTGTKVNIAWKLLGIPVSIFSGIAAGLLIGFILYRIFEKFNPRATKRLLVILGVSILFVSIEHWMEPFFPFAALLAVMAIGFVILERNEHMAHEMSLKLGKLWVFAEIILFTLVGAQVNLQVALKAGLMGSLIVFLGLIARSIGTYLSLLKSNLTFSERIFVVIAYLPKATVQAAIGGAPLLAMKLAGMNTQPGEVILAVAVLSILLTAPVGAWAIAFVGNRVLKIAPLGFEKGREKKEVTQDDIMNSFQISALMDRDIPTVRVGDSIEKVLNYFSNYDYLICSVVDLKNKFAGIIKLEHIRAILNDRSSWKIVLAHDVMQPLAQIACPSFSLKEGMTIAQDLELEEIPVVDQSSKKIVGILDIRKAKKFLEQESLELRQ